MMDPKELDDGVWFWEFGNQHLNDIREAFDARRETEAQRKTIDFILCLLANGRTLAGRDTGEPVGDKFAAAVSPS